MARNLLGRALVLVMTVGVLVAVSAPAQAATLTITWPEVTEFNPNVTDYVVDVAYDGDEYIFLNGGSESNPGASFVQPLSNGPNVAAVPDHHATEDFQFYVFICPTSAPFTPGCRLVAQQRGVRVYTTFLTELSRGVEPAGPHYWFRLDSLTPMPDSTVDISWELTRHSDPGGDPIATGTATGVSVGHRFDIEDPDGSIPRDVPLDLDVDITGEASPFGVLTRRTGAHFKWDVVNESTLSLQTFFSSDVRPKGRSMTFYPVDDGYADIVRIWVDGEQARVTGTVTNPAGTVVHEFGPSWTSSSNSFDWDGRDPSGGLVGPGRYAVRLESTDLAGNRAVLTAVLRVSHDRFVRKTWTASLTAEETVTDEVTGACGLVMRPARSDLPGSVGLYADGRCSSDGTFAKVLNRVDLPRSPAFYGNAVVKVRGARARGETSGHVLIRARQGGFGPGRQEWPIPHWSGLNRFYPRVANNGGHRPHLSWSSTTRGTNRWDLRTFDVSIDYLAVEN